MATTKDCKAKIMNFFKHVKDFFHKVFVGVEGFIDKYVVPALHFVEGLKAVVDNPAMDFLTAAIPGNLDDKIVQALRDNLPKVIDILDLEIACKDVTDPAAKIQCYIDYLRGLSPEVRNALYHKTASLLTKLLAGEHVFTDSDIDALVQLSYSELRHSNAIVDATPAVEGNGAAQ